MTNNTVFSESVCVGGWGGDKPPHYLSEWPRNAILVSPGV